MRKIDIFSSCNMEDIVLGLLSKFTSPESPQKVGIIVLILHA